MNKTECDQLIEAYLSWLRDGLKAEVLDHACELTTPFLDRHNDHLQIYAIKRHDRIELNDDGYILADVRASGLELNSPKRKEILQSLLNGLGVHLEEGRLKVDASPRNLGRKIHSLIQAMIAVNDMFVMAQPRVETFFWEDVRDFLDAHEVRYSSRIKLAGRSGFDHAIDFLVPRSRFRQERFIQAINNPAKTSVTSYVFAVSDIRQVRGEDIESFAFLNDLERPVGGDILDALEAYRVNPVPWSDRGEYVNALQA
jgi:hypothetical protein